jgi:hypothetical protein
MGAKVDARGRLELYRDTIQVCQALHALLPKNTAP